MPYFAYYIPDGPKNLNAGFYPDLDFTTIAEYYLEVLAGGTTIATTPILQLNGECCDDKVRLHFLNYLGAIDTINFKLSEDEHEAKSDEWQRPTPYPLVKSLHGRNRFNVKANDTLDLILGDYEERDMTWIDELVDSPLAWIEWLGTEGQNDDYLPIIVLDGRVKNKKSVDPFSNDVPISITYSHDKIIIRN